MKLDEIVQFVCRWDVETSRIHDIDSSSSSSPPPSKKPRCLNCFQQWVNSVMREMDAPQNKGDARDGRLGHDVVNFDPTANMGEFVYDTEYLSASSRSSLSTVRANTCVFRGRWQYEVQLGSKGVMRIGWATIDCKFSQEIGVGDTVNSYAYDGSHVCKWNVSKQKYGDTWMAGDIIGCTIDLDCGVLEFYRNGRTLGKAFDNVHVGPGMAYFPSVSLGFKENLIANFGLTPMKYPVRGFEPVQEAPFYNLTKAKKLVMWLSELLGLLEPEDEMLAPDVCQPSEPIIKEALLMRLAQIFLQPLAPLLLSPYIVEACLLPLLRSLCGVTLFSPLSTDKIPGGKKRLMFFLDMMWAFLEEHELKKSLQSVVICLLARFRQVSPSSDYEHQKESLLLLTYLVQHRRTRRHLLDNVLFDVAKFTNFLHMQSLDGSCMASFVRYASYSNCGIDKRVEQDQAADIVVCQIKDAVASVEALQVELLKILLDNCDGTPTQESSRRIFLRNFRKSLLEDALSDRAEHYMALNSFHCLLATFQALWKREVDDFPVVIPARTFYDGSVHYYNIDRLGGVLSHLNRTFKVDLMRVLGLDHPVITAMKLPGNLPQDLGTETNAAFISDPSVSVGVQSSNGHNNLMFPVLADMTIQQESSSSSSSSPLLVDKAPTVLLQKEKANCISLDAASSLIELLDGLILFYNGQVHKQLTKVSSLYNVVDEYTNAHSNVTARLQTYKHPPLDMPVEADLADIVQELELSCDVFRQKLSELARHMAWVCAVVCAPDKQRQLLWLLQVILSTVKGASQEGQLFAYVPSFYIDCLIEICSVMFTHMHPTSALENLEGCKQLLVEVCEFLCDHFTDPRIVHAGSKDSLIVGLARFTCSPKTLLSLESVPYVSRMSMVRALLQPYENRSWAQTNWILLRIWQGCGFAFRYHKSPHLLKKLGPKLLCVDSSLTRQFMQPCPSCLFQCHVREVVMSDEGLTTAFLNSLLNQLNWAFSELISMLQEIQNISCRPEQVSVEPRQLKACATCFDLTLALLRVLEMLASVAPEIFTDVTRSSSELLLSRLCQLLCQVLNRVHLQSGCFQHVVTLDIPELESVDHFQILTAVVGIMLALLRDDMQKFDGNASEVPGVTRTILTDPGFQLESVRFVLGDVQEAPTFGRAKPFSFCNYSDDVSVAEIEDVKRMIHLLNFYQGRLSEVTATLEDELCTICYAFPISATFRPCNHQSCRACIAHHLMNSRVCFFCKRPVQSVIGLDDSVLQDLLRLENESV